jgi:hypothetical protein
MKVARSATHTLLHFPTIGEPCENTLKSDWLHHVLEFVLYFFKFCDVSDVIYFKDSRIKPIT